MIKNLIIKSFVLLFLLSASNVIGQEMLYLKKKHTAKMVRLDQYDVLKIKLKNGEILKGPLYKITPTSIWVEDAYINYEDIEFIRHNHMFWKGVGRSLEIGAAMFTGIFVANGLIGGYSPILTQGNLIFIGSFLVAGIILELIAMRTYRMDKGWVVEPIIIPKE